MRWSRTAGRRCASPVRCTRFYEQVRALGDRRLGVRRGPSAKAAGIWSATDAVRRAECEVAHQTEVAYACTVRDWHAPKPRERERDTGACI